MIILAVIFFPSTVFWTSGNMKEGLTYWGICMMYSAVLTTDSRSSLVTPSLIAGTIVCGLMRPHMAIAWLIAIGSVMLLTRGRKVYALICLAALPILFAKMQTLAHTDFSSVDKTLQMLQTRSDGLRSMGGSVQTGPSIPVISGILAIFFRPFPWESHSFFMAVCALEIWTVTITMFRSWWKATAEGRRILWRMPAIRVALFAVLITSVLFSYLPNDGLLARQRVQIVPALMILTVLPLGLRSYLRNTRRIANARTAFGVLPTRLPQPGFSGSQFRHDTRHLLGTRSNRGAPP